MPSIVDPAEARGGAWTFTRGLMKAIELAWPGSRTECIGVPSPTRVGRRYRQFQSVISSALGAELPAKIAFTRTRRMRRGLKSALAEGPPDLIIINGSDLLWMLPDCPPGVPVAVVAYNIEHELYSRQIAQVARSSMARVLEKDCRKLRAFEWAAMQRAGRVIFVSEDDRRVAVEACPGIEAIAIPPVFDYEPLPRIASTHDRLAIGMFADFTWWPNRVSLDWFLREVWPAVSGDVELHLLGHGSEAAGTGVRGVTSHGFVVDPREAFARCNLMIAPIIDGAGVKVKVAEALYNRVPIVATSFALKGLPAAAVAAVRVCDEPDEWIAFLNSDAAGHFARRPVPAGAAVSFSLTRAAGLLSRFVRRSGEFDDHAATAGGNGVSS